MRLKLDENLSRYLKADLVRLGHDACTVADEQLLSMPDPVIARAAAAEDRILLTLDVEFGDLRKYPPGTHPGIVVFRPKSFGPLGLNRTILQFVETVHVEKLAGCVVIVEPTKIRVRLAPEK